MSNCIDSRLSRQQCPIDKKFSDLNSLEKCELLVEWVNQNWMKHTILIIGKTLIGVFFIGIISETFFKGKFDMLSNLNTWVGFILGLVATIFSVISMFLSFYNLEKAKESEEEIKKTLIEIKDTIFNTENNLKNTLNEISYSIKDGNNEILKTVNDPSKYSYYHNEKQSKSEITQY